MKFSINDLLFCAKLEIFQAENIKRCQYKVEITSENEAFPRIDYKETEIMKLKHQVQNFKCEIERVKLQLNENGRKFEVGRNFG